MIHRLPRTRRQARRRSAVGAAAATAVATTVVGLGALDGTGPGDGPDAPNVAIAAAPATPAPAPSSAVVVQPSRIDANELDGADDRLPGQEPSGRGTIVPATTMPNDVATSPAAATAAGPIAPPSDPRAAEPVITLGTINIPRLGVERTLYSGIRLSTLDRGPGHWPGTALPGEVGNVVIAGHRTSRNADFRDIDVLEPGDEIVLTTDSGTAVYRVTRTEIVPPSALWIVDPTSTPTLTLFACHPPGSVRERIAVFAELNP